MSEPKRKPGQPKKDPTIKPSLRISVKDWEAMKAKYPNQTNKMFKDWVSQMLTNPSK